MAMRSGDPNPPPAGHEATHAGGVDDRRRGPLGVWLFDHQTTLLAGALAIALVAGLVAATRHTGPISSAAGPAASLSPTEQLAGGQGPAGPSGSPSAAGTAVMAKGSGSSAQPVPTIETSKKNGPAPLTASDRGVTKDSVTLGWLAMSQETMVYGSSLGMQVLSYPAQDYVDPFVKDINAAGGIDGRKLKVAVVEYNPLSMDDMQAVCVLLAEDLKVFGTVAPAGYYGDAEVCLADKEIPTVTMNGSSADTNYRREKGWVRSTVMNKDRTLKNWVDWAVQAGTATSKSRIGVWWQDVPEDQQVVKDVLLPYLKSRGLNVVDKFVFSSDYSRTPTEASTATLRFKSSNVDLVWPAGNLLLNTLFTNEAEAQNYHPKYTASDFAQLAVDYASQNYNANQWDRVRALTVLRTGELVAGKPPTPQQKLCSDIYARNGGKPAKNTNDGAYTAFACEHMWLFVKAIRVAGPDLTRARFLAAMDSLGTYDERVTLSDSLTFRKGKYDAADRYAIVEWHKECKCYWQVEGFRKGAW
ncbi:MAG: ABC transporter substrate-binding protein [Actinomycetota bacterium]